MQQPEALPGPSLDQWHRSAGEEEDGPGTVLLGCRTGRARPCPRDPTATSLPSRLAVLTDEQKSRIQAMKPMTKEEWDARQSVIRKVVDPETGRTRCEVLGGAPPLMALLGGGAVAAALKRPRAGRRELWGLSSPLPEASSRRGCQGLREGRQRATAGRSSGRA